MVEVWSVCRDCNTCEVLTSAAMSSHTWMQQRTHPLHAIHELRTTVQFLTSWTATNLDSVPWNSHPLTPPQPLVYNTCSTCTYWAITSTVVIFFSLIFLSFSFFFSFQVTQLQYVRSEWWYKQILFSPSSPSGHHLVQSCIAEGQRKRMGRKM